MPRSWVGLLSLALLGACASVIGPSEQPVQLSVLQGGKELSGVPCTLSNARGEWQVVAPARAVVKRSGSPLRVRCVHPSWGQGDISLEASKAGRVGLALLTGGSVSGAVSGGVLTAASEDAFSYPLNARVSLR